MVRSCIRSFVRLCAIQFALASFYADCPHKRIILAIPAETTIIYYHQKVKLVLDRFCFYKFYFFLHDNGQVYFS